MNRYIVFLGVVSFFMTLFCGALSVVQIVQGRADFPPLFCFWAFALVTGICAATAKEND